MRLWLVRAQRGGGWGQEGGDVCGQEAEEGQGKSKEEDRAGRRRRGASSTGNLSSWRLTALLLRLLHGGGALCGRGWVGGYLEWKCAMCGLRQGQRPRAKKARPRAPGVHARAPGGSGGRPGGRGGSKGHGGREKGLAAKRACSPPSKHLNSNSVFDVPSHTTQTTTTTHHHRAAMRGPTLLAAAAAICLALHAQAFLVRPPPARLLLKAPLSSMRASSTLLPRGALHATTPSSSSDPPPSSRRNLFDPRRLKEAMAALRETGSAGLLAYGGLNALYYSLAVSAVWWHTSGGTLHMSTTTATAAGSATIIKRFVRVLALAWAGSQVQGAHPPFHPHTILLPTHPFIHPPTPYR